MNGVTGPSPQPSGRGGILDRHLVRARTLGQAPWEHLNLSDPLPTLDLSASCRRIGQARPTRGSRRLGPGAWLAWANPVRLGREAVTLPSNGSALVHERGLTPGDPFGHARACAGWPRMHARARSLPEGGDLLMVRSVPRRVDSETNNPGRPPLPSPAVTYPPSPAVTYRPATPSTDAASTSSTDTVVNIQGWMSRPVRRVLFRRLVTLPAATVIHLRRPLPTASSALPGCSGGPP